MLGIRTARKSGSLSGIVTDAYDQVMDISGCLVRFRLDPRFRPARPCGWSRDGMADLLEGTDQHRGWFHSSLLQACGTHGSRALSRCSDPRFTLDAKGMKMSKSIGNTIVPEKIVQQYGADILRLWVAQTDYTNDQRIGDEILKGTADSYRRLAQHAALHAGSLC